MGFANKKELTEHCETILKSARINNKVVILCEGDMIKVKNNRNPQSYRNLEKMPDSNFYKHCVPKFWKNDKPQFFNCGDRNDVIDTYFQLLKLNKNDKNSYLTSDFLYAIIDLDIQTKNISNYQFATTEDIYENLYSGIYVNIENSKKHKIWTTGLIHKEAYFIIPELQEIFNDFIIPIKYNNTTFDFNQIYIDIAKEINNDVDLKDNLSIACNRINY